MKKRVVLDLPEETIKYLKALAKANKTTVSRLVEDKFRSYLISLDNRI
ncbi:DUF6364 family protein [Mucilaginibacter pedocola]